MIYPVVKSGCGVFGILRLDGADAIAFPPALAGIECMRFRGSGLGAGFASVNLSAGEHFTVKAFVDGPDTAAYIRDRLSLHASLRLTGEEHPGDGGGRPTELWTGWVEGDHGELWKAIMAINLELSKGGFRGRIYSYGKHLTVYKGVGYPVEVARQQGLLESGARADLWLAHTRQPTNSPGFLPIWSHPFACFDWAIVHNGDISSFGSNMEFLMARGVKGFVGTDSEVIAYLLDHLTRVEGLGLEEAALLLCRPYEGGLRDLDAGLRDVVLAFRGAALDGPFTVLAGYCDGRDVYMLALLDRSKFRPIVIGEDGGYVYVASEECAIRAVAPEARVYAPEPNRFFLASLKQGIVEPGRHHLNCRLSAPGLKPDIPDLTLDASGMDYQRLNIAVLEAVDKAWREVTLVNVNGQRYIGVNLPRRARLVVHGTPGNCLANHNEGAEIIVYGNAEDDVGDAMQDGRVVIHGDARDVIGQALQGGEIFVKGSVGNRGAIQMREYGDRRPFLLVGNKADDCFGEYMAGGVAMVLGLQSLARNCDCPVVGNYLATGMVGGRIYVRGRVPPSRIGLPPPREDLLPYLEAMMDEGLVERDEYRRCFDCGDLGYTFLREVLNPVALRKVQRLYMGKGDLNLAVAYRRLSEADLGLVRAKLTSFFDEFGLEQSLYQTLVDSEFTIIAVGEGGG